MKAAPSRSQGNDYEPLSRRRRWLLLALAVATAVTLMWMLLERPGGVSPERVGAPPAGSTEPPRCADGRGAGCVGGITELRVVPAASAPGR